MNLNIWRYFSTWNSRCLIGALIECIKIIITTKEHIHSSRIEGSAQAKVIDDKITKVLEKKVEFDQLQKISNISNGKNKSIDGLPADCSIRTYHFLSLHH
jgi:hypothetical protein